MWNEESFGISVSDTNNLHDNQSPKPAIVASVEPGSIGEVLGFESGDKLLSINGIQPRDLIDYRFLISENELNLQVIDKNGKLFSLTVEKEEDEELGLMFTEALFDGLRQCNNQCPFCFIDQQPPGKRKSLYLKDDDYRLSFLYGSYLTLTNLNETDWERIETQRLSPLYISVHATEAILRSNLLKNPKAGLFMDQLEWFAKRRLQIHAQIVVCPGINDGKALEKTIDDLSSFAKGDWPTVLSVAVVPVGLTRFRPKNDGLIPVDNNCAIEVISQVKDLQKKFQKLLGTRFAWLSDEWYLIAGQSLPKRNAYEDLPQEENGVGSIRAFLTSMDISTQNLPNKIERKRTCSWVVGRLVEEALRPSSQRLNKIDGLTVHLYGLPSPYWGQEQVVTGLLTGHDLIEGLHGQELGDELLLPSIMLREDKGLFLDDMTLEELEHSLDITIRIVHGAEDIVQAALGNIKNSLELSNL